ncbi:6-phosphogluconolactonase [Rhizophlyctis rosea]|uniref:6-phosphogluconolactonase n=1 Tax=Rhizophlyctis rosea TaxID=64517 RepID=A0AAD5S886_9FUNG|nr:6-phosphogluconolactonase [Rhizophlyctis rosea]
MATPTIYVSPTSAHISASLNHLITRLSATSISRSNKFTVAISGGSLPKILAADLKSNTTIDFTKWHVFFADERVVPIDHDDSNFKAAKETLFAHVPIPREQIYTVEPSLSHDKAAEEYTQQLKKVFGADGIPQFDLILLGMGPDGHTCSLFPGHPLLEVEDRWVASLDDSPKPPPQRITLTYPVVNNAETVAFVATGEGKAEVLHKIFDLKEDFPSGRVTAKKNLLWFVDEPAMKGVQFQTKSYQL